MLKEKSSPASRKRRHQDTRHDRHDAEGKDKGGPSEAVAITASQEPRADPLMKLTEGRRNSRGIVFISSRESLTTRAEKGQHQNQHCIAGICTLSLVEQA